ncbi:MAG: O-antigen ligase family protein [Proteobacteria bacterium]|nr:O-antigen ligase family protein [Pseudomonadota bacterium]
MTDKFEQKNMRIIYSIILTGYFSAIALIVIFAPSIYFSDELKKYIVIVLMFCAMIFFAFWVGLYKSAVFFWFQIISANFGIIYLFFSPDMEVISKNHIIMIPDLFILISWLFLTFSFRKKQNTDSEESLSTIVIYIVFMMYFLLISLHSKEYIFAMTEFINFSRIVIVFSIFKYIQDREPEAKSFVIYGIAFLIITQGTIGIGQEFGIDLFSHYMDSNYTYIAGSFNRIGGTLGRVKLHSLLYLTLPLIFTQIVTSKNQYKKMVMLISFVLGIIALALTRNRGPMLSTIAGVGYICYKFKYYRVIKVNFKLLLYSLAFVVLTIFFFSFGGEDFQQIMNRPTYIGRIYQNTEVLNRFYNSQMDQFFLGFGPQQYLVDKSSENKRNKTKIIYNIHNQYILMLYEGGVIGLLLYITWLISFYRKTLVYRNREGLPLTDFESLKIGISGSIISLVIASVSRPIHDNVSFTLLGIYMALISNTSKSLNINNLT